MGGKNTSTAANRRSTAGKNTAANKGAAAKNTKAAEKDTKARKASIVNFDPKPAADAKTPREGSKTAKIFALLEKGATDQDILDLIVELGGKESTKNLKYAHSWVSMSYVRGAYGHGIRTEHNDKTGVTKYFLVKPVAEKAKKAA